MADPLALAWAPLLLAAGAGLVGGAMNALAGGGTFATLPALILSGMSPLAANITSTVALFPGQLSSGWAGRRLVVGTPTLSFRKLVLVSLLGGAVGAWLLLNTPSSVFARLVPWLVLYAFVVLAFGKRASAWLAQRVTIGPRALVACQALLGIYGGYFGGGVGLMTTATYGLLAAIDPRAMFAPRTLMLAIANAAAAIVFVAAGLVAWRWCLPMLAGAILGGWGGAIVGKRLPAGAVRAWTLLVTGATTLVFFWRAYF